MSDTQLMETRQNGLATQQPPRAPAIQSAGYGKTGVIFRSFSELWSFAGVLSKSGMAPKGMGTEALAVALQLGAELGLPPMASIQNIAVINGRPSLWGDAQLAVCRATGEVESFGEWYEQGGKRLERNPTSFDDTTTAVTRVKRVGMEPTESAFSVADAKRAKLWGKPGPWTDYPHRMLRNRARSFALRDTFGDALRGLMSSDEASDVPYVIQGNHTGLPTGSLDDAVRGPAQGEVANQEEAHQQTDVSSTPPAGAIPQDAGGAGEPTSAPAGETPDTGAATEEKQPDPAAANWNTFVDEAYEIGKARNVDPELMESAIKALKLTNLSSARRGAVADREAWLAKFASGAKVKADGTFE